VLAQEFVIGGYTEPADSLSHFGALLVGHYEGDRLRYGGKVGTGYSAERSDDAFGDLVTGRCGNVSVEDSDVVGVDPQQLQSAVAVTSDVCRDRFQA
jgi:ATP-dependent DNA ligase